MHVNGEEDPTILPAVANVANLAVISSSEPEVHAGCVQKSSGCFIISVELKSCTNFGKVCSIDCQELIDDKKHLK